MARRQSPGSGKGVGAWLSLLGFLILAVWLGWLAFRGVRVASHLGAMRALIAETEQLATTDARATLASPEKMVSLCDKLAAVDSELDGLAHEGEVFLNLAPLLGWIPRYGYDVQSAPQLLAMTQEMLAAGMTLCEAGTRLATPLQQVDAGADRWSVAIRTAQDQQPHFRLARQSLDSALTYRAEIDAWRVSETLAEPLAKFDRLADKLAVGLRAAELGPYLLGADGAHTYLVLAQNEDELRPTGGFISAAGRVRVENGRITDLAIADSYSFDDFSKPYPWPPYPLHEYMGADYWLLRDANWSPDFPTAAETAAGLYLLSTGVDVDGVISIDQAALEYLLASIGPVEVSGESGGVWVSAENLALWMQNNWAPAPGQAQDREWWTQRKSFVSELAAALLNRVEGGANLSPVNILQGILRALEEKHILIYDRRPEAAALLYDLSWDGHIDRSVGDYFAAVEANVSFNKASGMIARSLDYSVALGEDGDGAVTVELHYQHQSRTPVDFCDPTSRYDAVYSAMMDRCYWNYLRLIVPIGAELGSYPPVVVPGAYLLRGRPSDDGIAVERVNDARKSWGQLFLLAPGDSATLRYTYQTPAGTAHKLQGHWQYRLLLQKQPGIRTLPVSLSVRLPDGMGLLGSVPWPSLVEGQTLHYALDLSSDQLVRIDYGP